jgi:mitochondrial fission protein ELM1
VNLPRCWVLTDTKIGTENQCLGLAEALGLAPIVHRIELSLPWAWTAPFLPMPRSAALAGLSEPWPDLIITAGRQSVLPALAVKRRAVTVAVQDPRVAPSRFDLVIAPAHDRVVGDNVLATLGAMHRVTKHRLELEATRFAPLLAHLPRPRVAVIIGGDSRVHRLRASVAARLAAHLAQLAETYGLLVTLSRRTSQEAAAVLRAAIADHPNVVLWSGTGPNPFFAYLALADAILVTEDSVSMISEAASTGKPVHVVRVAGGSHKFDRFHRAMRDAGVTRPFHGAIEHWAYKPLDDTARAASRVRDLLAARGFKLPDA